MEITVRGLRVHYIDQGSGDQTVLLLHGWGVDSSVYHLITDHLSGYCRMIVPDLPGFGKSEEPPKPWTTIEYADFVLEFCKALGVTEAITMGHSNGGRILLELLSRDTCPLTVRKAVLLDSAGIPAHHSFGYYARVYTFKCVKAILSLPGIRHLFPDAVDKARRRFGSSDYRQASAVMRQSMVLALGYDCTPLLPRVKASTLLIWGRNDTATPLSDGQLMEKRIPDAGLVVLEGGHYAFAEQFAQCRRVLDSFLSHKA
ncbi:MAG: alpha/beta hydrolase [Clostridia bacterium]|nr:alpha/beta hydrolase [Clostridia bacterium]